MQLLYQATLIRVINMLTSLARAEMSPSDNTAQDPGLTGVIRQGFSCRSATTRRAHRDFTRQPGKPGITPPARTVSAS